MHLWVTFLVTCDCISLHIRKTRKILSIVIITNCWSICNHMCTIYIDMTIFFLIIYWWRSFFSESFCQYLFILIQYKTIKKKKNYMYSPPTVQAKIESVSWIQYNLKIFTVCLVSIFITSLLITDSLV